MGKKQVKHFVPNKSADGIGIPACNCFRLGPYDTTPLPALRDEIAKTRRGVTCKRCQGTRVFRKLK